MNLTEKEHKRISTLMSEKKALGASWSSLICSGTPIQKDLSKHSSKDLTSLRDFLAYVKKNFTTLRNRSTDSSVRNKVAVALARKGAVDHSATDAMGPVKVYRFMQKLNVANEKGLVAGPNGSLLRAVPKAMKIGLSDPHVWPSNMFGCGEIWATGSLQDILTKVNAASKFSCKGQKIGRYENYGGGTASAAGSDLDKYLDEQVGKGAAASHDVNATLYTHLYAGVVVQESEKNYTVEADAAMEIVKLVGSKIGALAGQALSPAASNPFKDPMDAIGWVKDTAESPLPFSQESLVDKAAKAVKNRKHVRSVPLGGMFSLAIGSDIHPAKGFAATKEWGNAIAREDLVKWLQASSCLKGK